MPHAWHLHRLELLFFPSPLASSHLSLKSQLHRHLLLKAFLGPKPQQFLSLSCVSPPESVSHRSRNSHQSEPQLCVPRSEPRTGLRAPGRASPGFRSPPLYTVRGGVSERIELTGNGNDVIVQADCPHSPHHLLHSLCRDGGPLPTPEFSGCLGGSTWLRLCSDIPRQRPGPPRYRLVTHL